MVGNTSNLLFVEKIRYPVVFTNRMKDEYSVEKNIILTGDSHLRKSDFKNVKVGGKIYDLEHNLFDKLKKRLLGIM